MKLMPTPDTNAAMVLGIASTALPFAPSREEEAERWLRILRLHGEAGSALQALGVSEAPLERTAAATAPVEDTGQAPAHEHGERSAGHDDSREVIAAVTDCAVRAADRRGASAVATSDVLVAVMDVYGADFSHVLRLHGTDREEVLERLAVESPGSAAA